MRWAGLVVAIIVGAGMAVLPPGTLSHDRVVARASGTSDPRPLATYLSTSGIPHADVADVQDLRAGVGWDRGDPNGIDRSWRRALEHVWDQLASEHADAVFLTGDLVRGYWGVDADRTGIFGPVNTYRHRIAAVKNAGNAYEGTLRRAFARHHLTVYPGMGDHEIGDLPHDGRRAPSAFSARALRAWVSTWSRNFHERPYYHVRLPGDVELWTIKPFSKNTAGGVSTRLSRQELTWLRTSLRSSTARWKIVQSEIPPYSSPGFLGLHTSRTHLLGADQFFRILARHGVDLVLSGEFHRVDTLQRRGVPEIIHGGNLMFARANYLVIRVYADHLRVILKRMPHGSVDGTRRLWAPSGMKRPPAVIRVPMGASVTGRMTITHDGVRAASGGLALR